MADKVTSIPAIKPLKIDPVPIGELSEPMGGIDFDGISSPSLAAEEPAVEKIREHVEEDAERREHHVVLRLVRTDHSHLGDSHRR